MDVTKILAEIDSKIASLQQARLAIVSLEEGAPLKAKRGRPKGSTNIAKPAKPARKKRNLTPEGRKRIAEAMKRRWAAQRKPAATKEAAKK